MFCERCEKETPNDQKIRILAEGSPYPGTNEQIARICVECFKELLQFFYIDDDVLYDMTLGHLEDEVILALQHFSSKGFIDDFKTMIARVLGEDITR